MPLLPRLLLALLLVVVPGSAMASVCPTTDLRPDGSVTAQCTCEGGAAGSNTSASVQTRRGADMMCGPCQICVPGQGGGDNQDGTQADCVYPTPPSPPPFDAYSGRFVRRYWDTNGQCAGPVSNVSGWTLSVAATDGCVAFPGGSIRGSCDRCYL